MTETTLAAAMDRLTDWVASFVPGCSRLPTRHPIKVSLVMGGLGLLAGWLTVAPAALLEALQNYEYQWLFNFLPGVFLATVTLWPLLVWQQRSPGWFVLSLVLALAAGVVHLMLINHLGHGEGGPSIEGFTIAGTLAGVVYAAVGIAVNSRREWWMLAPVMAVSGLFHSGFLLTSEAALSRVFNLPFDLDRFVAMSLAANLFAGVFAALGVTLGAALWDRTPPPRFEADGELS